MSLTCLGVSAAQEFRPALHPLQTRAKLPSRTRRLSRGPSSSEIWWGGLNSRQTELGLSVLGDE